MEPERNNHEDRHTGQAALDGMSWIGRHELATLVALMLVAAATWGFAKLANEVVEGQTNSLDKAVLLTARSQTQDIQRAKDCSIDDYIIKPFDLSELLEKIESILERRKSLVSAK